MAFYFKLDIPNIFKKHEPHRCISGNDWFHKLPFDRSIEVNYGNIDDTLMSFNLSILFRGRDHAGPSIELSLLGYGVNIEFPKSRHWNYRKNCWLEDYKTYMAKCVKLADKIDAGENHHDYMFSEYYEDGYSPEEAVDLYVGNENEISDFLRSCRYLISDINYDYLLDIDENKLKDLFKDGNTPEEAVKKYLGNKIYTLEEYTKQSINVLSGHYLVNDETIEIIKSFYEKDLPLDNVFTAYRMYMNAINYKNNKENIF